MTDPNDAEDQSDVRTPGAERRDERAPAVVVEDVVADAHTAMRAVAEYDQAAADDLARAVALAVYRESHADGIAERTVADTGMGTVADKRAKLRGRMLAILADALETPTVGELPTERPGVTEYARPVGVVGALVPSTNPGPTVANVALLALRGRNAVVFSASPSGMGPARLTVDYIRAELDQIGAPPDLVQLLPAPANKERAHELLSRVDLVQVTGSSANVEAGETCGTPNYCVGEGNLVAIVDETAAIEAAAEAIATGTAYEYGIACVGESNLVAHQAVYDDLLETLAEKGGYLCSSVERDRIETTLFPQGDGSLDREFVGTSPTTIAEAADVAADEPAFLVVEAAGIGPEYPLSGEKLAPVVTAHEVASFEAALERTRRLLEYEGTGHSCTIHTEENHQARRAGRELPVCRLAINQSGLGPAGTADNGLHTTYSLGGGPWAGNQLDENLSSQQFITSTRVARPLDRTPPSPEGLFDSIVDNRETRHGRVSQNEAGDTSRSTDEGGRRLFDRLFGLLSG